MCRRVTSNASGPGPRRVSHPIQRAFVLLAHCCFWREAVAAPHASRIVRPGRARIEAPWLAAAQSPRKCATAS